jgi:arsenical pump membrane protein
MFVRPNRIPEAVWACLGAGLLLAFQLVPLTEALGAIIKGYDVYFFLSGMMVLVHCFNDSVAHSSAPREG